MAKRALPLLTGGLNEVTRSDIIADSQLQQCDNYEIIGDGVLKKRKSQEIYDQGLNNVLNYFFSVGAGGSVLKISEPYYPQKKLSLSTGSEMVSDFILFVVGLLPNEEHYTIYSFFQRKIDTISWVPFIYENTITLPELLSDAGINYPIDSVDINNIEFTIGNNRVVISDGYNKMHYFEIDADGIANTGFLGIPAPLNKPCVLPLDTNSARGDISYDNVKFEDDSGADYIEAPGLAQITYTVITKFGEESNPSPISDALDLQYFKLNEDTGANEMWIDAIEIFNLNIPVVPKSVEDTLEKFRVYLRMTPYSQGITAKTLTFTEEFNISKKTTDAVGEDGESTGNNFIMTVAPSTGQIVSYENDVAPVAKTSAELGGITIAGNISTLQKFPFEFKYVHPISINNQDSKFYVEPCIRIRLNESDIENFEILDFIVNGNTDSATDSHLKRSEFIRIYFEDQTTPCTLGYVNRIDSDGNAVSLDHNTQPSYVDLLIKIPYLRANDTTTIYLVWTPDNDADELLYTGVPSTYNDLIDEDVTFSGNIGIEYGRIQALGGYGYSRHKLFPKTRVLDSNTVLAFDFSFKNNSGFLFNKADGNSVVIQEGDIPQDAGDEKITGYSAEISPTVLGYNNYPIFDVNNNERISQSYWKVNNFDSGIVLDNKFFKESSLDGKSGFLSFWWDTSEATLYNYLRAEYANTYGYSMVWDIATIWGEDHGVDYIASGGKVLRLSARFDGSNDFPNNPRFSTLQLSIDDNGTSHGYVNDPVFLEDFTLFGGEVFDTYENDPAIYTPEFEERLFITLSWNSDQSKVCIFIMNLDGVVYKREIDWGDRNKITDGSFHGVVIGSHIGSNYATDEAYESSAIKNSKYMDVTMKLGTYVDDYTVFKNYSNRMGLFEKVIGYKENEDGSGTPNNNIEFSETELTSGKKQQNMIKWTDVNYSSFPDLNYKILKEPVKRIIAAPSFLQYQYQNTFLIFTRNTINRFVLEGSASGWAASSSSLIEEKKQYGLLADRSLMRIGDAVFWLSEVGVVKWDSQGLNLISKNVVNVKIEEDSFAFYNSINNQYMLHQPVDGNTYVYHIDRNMWTKYTGLNIISTGILTGGNELANINLLLNGGGGIDKFPSDSYTNADSRIKTKELFFENGLLKRVRLDYTGGSPDLTTNLTKIDSSGLEIEKSNTITGIQKNKWRGIANGFNRGRSVNIEITNAEEINSIMYDLNIESEVKT